VREKLSVPISASGLQGEQPLASSKNVSKGSRQNTTGNFGITVGSGVCLMIGVTQNCSVKECLTVYLQHSFWMVS